MVVGPTEIAVCVCVCYVWSAVEHGAAVQQGGDTPVEGSNSRILCYVGFACSIFYVGVCY